MSKYLSLKSVNSAELQQDWGAVMQDLHQLANWIIRTFAVDSSNLEDEREVVISSNEPEGGAEGKLWVKTSAPPGIGIYFSKKYQLIYPYPPNVPMLWTTGEDNQPSYLRRLDSAELEAMNLPTPNEDSYHYVILEV